MELKYGGKIDALGRFSAVNFPLVRTKNINIEQSVSQLHLPESHRWFNFGGTMRLVEQADVAAEQLSYQNKQAERQLETMQQADPYAQARVMNNFNAMRSSLDESMRQVVHGSNVANANLKRELEKSAKISQQAQTATAQPETGSRRRPRPASRTIAKRSPTSSMSSSPSDPATWSRGWGRTFQTCPPTGPRMKAGNRKAPSTPSGLKRTI